ncbi:MAG: UMP kinase [Candidatus Heimdallarchaeota archaeon]|nr:UMP kinase [Candidatus Heimdallarchaeota archaeon]
MKLVIKIGGSILFKKNSLDISLIENWISEINNLIDEGHQIGIVIGGGRPAREYIATAKTLGANQAYQDFLGIESARQNARLFISALENAYPIPPRNFEELLMALSSHNLVICGGFQPGQSTNAVAAIFAEQMQANYLFNMTKVHKVFDKDPNIHEDAKSFDFLDYSQLQTIISQNEQKPGKYDLFDYLGMEVVKRSRIKLVFLDGTKPNYIRDTLLNNCRGTIVGQKD